MGSFAGLASTPLLATYSGTKAFLAGWSQALGEELRRSNVHVELVNTYFVVSAMSKIRRASAMVPTPRQYVKQTLATIGNAGGAVGRPYTSTPWPLHAIVDWAMSYVLPKSWLLSYQYGECPAGGIVLARDAMAMLTNARAPHQFSPTDMQVQTRKRAIRKQERALKAQ